ncbi:MAG: peptidylprolyl isomerase [Candidatus Moraniibacteriota bacterium]|jgi:cyclophilin family peptidyl-prolyl cis-trans isomerase
MKKPIGVALSCCAFLVLTGCQQDSQIANKQAQQTEKAKGYVKTLTDINTEAKKNLEDAVNKENDKLEKALEDTIGKGDVANKVNNNSQQSKTMDNIPQQINMEFAQTCKSATLKTNKGDITIKFYNEDAPVAVANFCTISDKGDYDNVVFHRVIKDFMIQGGDPDGTGFGGPDYKFGDEIHSNNKNNVGTIALANSGPGTNGSQFFINTAPNNFLDTKHTVFGEVTGGMDVVTTIEEVEVGAQDKPVEDVIIESVVLVKE